MQQYSLKNSRCINKKKLWLTILGAIILLASWAATFLAWPPVKQSPLSSIILRLVSVILVTVVIIVVLWGLYMVIIIIGTFFWNWLTDSN